MSLPDFLAYGQIVYSLPETYPTIQRSTLVLATIGPTLAKLEGRVKQVLEQAFDDLRRGREWRAITALHAFLRSGLVQPNSYPFLEGSYGLGKAFFDVKMYQSASGHLVGFGLQRVRGAG